MKISAEHAQEVLNGTFENQSIWDEVISQPSIRRYLTAYAHGFLLLDDKSVVITEVTPCSIMTARFIEYVLVYIQNPHYVQTKKYLKDTSSLPQSPSEIVDKARQALIANVSDYLRVMDELGQRYMEMRMSYDSYIAFSQTYCEHWVKNGTNRFYQKFSCAKKFETQPESTNDE